MFTDWLEQYYPNKRDKVLNRVKDIRGGKLNDANFSSRMRGTGIFADQMNQLFQMARQRSGITDRWPKLTSEHFRVPGRNQLKLL